MHNSDTGYRYIEIRCKSSTDRYVLLGNHRDAWVFGAVDASSGTAPMQEVSRAMGKLVQEGIHII